MSVDLVVWLFVITALTLGVSRFFRLSSRYERKPRHRSAWNQLDDGDDPTGTP